MKTILALLFVCPRSDSPAVRDVALLVFLPGELLRVGPNERLEQQFVMPSNCSNIYGIDMSNASAERTCCLGNAQCSEQNTQYAACTLYLFNSGIC